MRLPDKEHRVVAFPRRKCEKRISEVYYPSSEEMKDLNELTKRRQGFEAFHKNDWRDDKK